MRRLESGFDSDNDVSHCVSPSFEGKKTEERERKRGLGHRGVLLQEKEENERKRELGHRGTLVLPQEIYVRHRRNQDNDKSLTDYLKDLFNFV